MLKRLDAAYGQGLTKVDGLWWTWKIEPMTIDCVLIYAQAGHGRRASLYTDYTFAVWNRLPLDALEAEAVVKAISAAPPPQRAKAPSGGSAARPASSVKRQASSVKRQVWGAMNLKREPTQPEALQLVSFAKAYSGLTDVEFKQIDSVIRKITLENFGPVRSVKPSLVFELGFDGINPSLRHKSGIAVRFPRMLRIRKDKPLRQANTLDDLKMLLK